MNAVVVAVVLAVLAAVMFAVAATLQNGAVTGVAGDDGSGATLIRGAGLRRLLRAPTWLTGALIAAVGSVTHAGALVLAPVAIVQPIGVLAVPFAIVIAAVRVRRRPTALVLVTVLVCLAAVAGFVTLADARLGATTRPSVGGVVAAALTAAALAGGLSVIATRLQGWLRCAAFAASGATAFGLVSALMRLISLHLTTGAGDLDDIGVLLPAAGVVAALLVGGWAVQQAHASGVPAVVVGCLTVIDPIVAVTLGLTLLGEGGTIPMPTAPSGRPAMSVVPALCDDLAAEVAALDARLAVLAPEVWATPTPAAGWDIALGVGHLCYFDETALLALTDPDRFDPLLDLDAPDRPDEALGRALGPAELLARWRASRAALLAAARAADPALRVPWYGPAMGVASFVSARIMETWAHGTDIADALGLPPVTSARLRHICHIGVTARPFAFAVHGVVDPGDPVRVEATGPGGELWTWGADGVADRIEGSALDLALVVTQRRHRDDTDVRATGSTAAAWLAVAQAFAGPPGPGRATLRG